jgi:hypothetical protein
VDVWVAEWPVVSAAVAVTVSRCDTGSVQVLCQIVPAAFSDPATFAPVTVTLRILPPVAVTVIPWLGLTSPWPVAGVMLSCTGSAAAALWAPGEALPPAVPDPDWQAAASRPTAQIVAIGSDRRRDEVLIFSTLSSHGFVRSVVY